MAEMTRIWGVRHVRSESSAHLVHYSGGAAKREGRGLSFWFLPLSASLVEVPMDDRELSVLFHTTTADFQDVAVQVVMTWRVSDPARLASRVDFTLDLDTGRWNKEPLEQLSQLLTQLAQQVAFVYAAGLGLRELLLAGVEPLRQRIVQELSADTALSELGLVLVSARIVALRPDAETEGSLRTPAREAVGRDADEAKFQRRASAVQKERAIAENELRNRIELARQEEELIAQKGVNERRKAVEDAERDRIGAEARAARDNLASDTESRGIRLLETARNEMERERSEIYREMPPTVLLSMAARELAGNMPTIEHLSLGPDAIGSALQRLLVAGTERLESQP